MRLAENSLPKRKEEEHEGMVFGTLSEGAAEAMARSAGKVLLLSDDGSLSGLSMSPRAVSVIFDGDALPLFLMPDGVSRVLAAGGKETLWAARYFAGVRRIPCTLFPADATLDGVFEREGEIVLGGEKSVLPLSEGEAVCDAARLSPTLADGYARLLLTRLAFFEAEALTAFGIPRRGIKVELPQTAEEIVAENARARRAESEGGYCGEGKTLAALLKGESPPWSAYLLLSALYSAFFEKGKPRRYDTPNYRARARRAGVEYASLAIPSREEYAERAMILERVRARFAREIAIHIAKREEYYAAVSRFRPSLPQIGGDAEILMQLPEHAHGGLSSVIRDFGLMEWNDKASTVKRN